MFVVTLLNWGGGGGGEQKYLVKLLCWNLCTYFSTSFSAFKDGFS